jgi:hypothetical protein
MLSSSNFRIRASAELAEIRNEILGKTGDRRDVPHFSPIELSTKCFLSLVPQPAHARAGFTSVREKSCPLNKSGSPLDFASA